MSNTQVSYRIRTDATKAQGGSPVWAAAEKVNAVVPSGVPLRVRYQIAQGGAYDPASYSYALYYSKNGGTFTKVGTTGDVIYADPTLAASPDGQVLTTELMSPISAFQGIGLYCPKGTAKTQPVLSAANTNMEFEFGFQFVSPGCDGNKYVLNMSLSTGYNSSYPLVSNFPTFSMAQRAALAQTEASDTLAGVMIAPNAGVLSIIEVGDGLLATGFVNLPNGILNATEASDVLTGAAIGTAIGVLAQTEAPDGLTGAGFVSAVGGLTANLAETEGNDTLAGVGTGSGNIASLRQTEANDSLTGSGGGVVQGVLSATENDDWISFSQTVMYLNQWVPVPPTGDVWVPIEQIDSYMFEDVLEPVDG